MSNFTLQIRGILHAQTQDEEPAATLQTQTLDQLLPQYPFITLPRDLIKYAWNMTENEHSDTRQNMSERIPGVKNQVRQQIMPDDFQDL